MTKMTKRAFSLLLTLTLLITILPYNVWADEQQKSDSRQNENNVTLSYMVVDKPKIEKNSGFSFDFFELIFNSVLDEISALLSRF